MNDRKAERLFGRLSPEQRYRLFVRLVDEFGNQLVGNAGVAEILDIEASRVSRFYRGVKPDGSPWLVDEDGEPAMPAPVAIVSGKPVWLREDIEAIRGIIDSRRRKVPLASVR